MKIRVFLHYLKTIGIIISFIIFASGFLQEVLLVASRFWLAKWSSVPKFKAMLNRNLFIGVYGLFGLGQGLFVLVLAFSIAIASYSSSKKIHNQLLDTIMHCPMNFFDTTPIGRIINRFTKDIYALDYALPTNLQPFIINIMAIFGIIYVTSYLTPIFIAVFIPIFILYVFTQVRKF